MSDSDSYGLSDFSDESAVTDFPYVPSDRSSSVERAYSEVTSPEIISDDSDEDLFLPDVQILDNTVGPENGQIHLPMPGRRRIINANIMENYMNIVNRIEPFLVDPDDEVVEVFPERIFTQNRVHRNLHFEIALSNNMEAIPAFADNAELFPENGRPVNREAMPEIDLANNALDFPENDLETHERAIPRNRGAYNTEYMNENRVDESAEIISDDESEFEERRNAFPEGHTLGTLRHTLRDHSSSKDPSKSPIISKIKRVKRSLDEYEEDGQTCSICFESWSNSGEHRIAALKCGHLFGKKCIERWIKESSSRCPQCNARSIPKDIRVLYAKSIRTLDTTEQDRLSQELTKVKSEKNSLERKHAKVLMNNEINVQLISKLQEELRMLRESLKNNCVQTVDVSGAVLKMRKLALYKSFDLLSGCRVMCYNEWLSMLIVSVTTNVGMFRGCGVKKINLFDMRIDKYIPIHRREIRDLSFNSMNKEVLLSVSMDRCIKITNVSSNATLQQYKLTSPIYSCCWKAQSSTEFYIGNGQGRVLHYNTAFEEPVDIITVSGSGQVVSLWYIPSIEGVDTEGLLVVHLDSVCFLEFTPDGKKEHKLGVKGSFIGANFDPDSNKILINCRPSDKHPHARHTLCTLVSVEIDGNRCIELRAIHTFLGSSTMKLLYRSSIVVTMFDKTFVIVNEESTFCGKMYDASSFQLVQKIHFSANVLECLCARIQAEYYIIFLTEKKAHLYKMLEQQ